LGKARTGGVIAAADGGETTSEAGTHTDWFLTISSGITAWPIAAKLPMIGGHSTRHPTRTLFVHFVERGAVLALCSLVPRKRGNGPACRARTEGLQPKSLRAVSISSLVRTEASDHCRSRAAPLSDGMMTRTA
jgi:hypothetical protein